MSSRLRPKQLIPIWKLGAYSKIALQSYLHPDLSSELHSDQHIEKAVDSARAARKKRWICFFIILIILIIVGIVVAVVITNNTKKH